MNAQELIFYFLKQQKLYSTITIVSLENDCITKQGKETFIINSCDVYDSMQISCQGSVLVVCTLEIRLKAIRS